MIVNVPAWYYQQYDADYSLNYPGEGFGGWKQAVLPMDTDKTALVIMHATDAGTREQYPGWHRAVEYLPRSVQIANSILKKLLGVARQNGVRVYHVVFDHDYYSHLPGFQRALSLTQPSPALPQIPTDPTMEFRNVFKADHSHPGARNRQDVERGFRVIDFIPAVKPLDSEAVAKNADQLYAVAAADGINHLIYTGFAINYCLQYSPAGMLDMSRRGFTCSAVREAVTAVENRESARTESHKEYGLWITAMMFGLVYDADDLMNAFQNQ